MLQFSNSPILQLANSLVVLLLCTSCSSPAAPATPQASVDVLSYLLGDPALWPRRGSHGQNQIVDFTRREVCWVKYGNPRRFECWRWDDRFIYHAVDHGLDGDSNESYLLTDGRWRATSRPAPPPRLRGPSTSPRISWSGSTRRAVSTRHAPMRSRTGSAPGSSGGTQAPIWALATPWSSNISPTIRSARPAPPSTTISDSGRDGTSGSDRASWISSTGPVGSTCQWTAACGVTDHNVRRSWFVVRRSSFWFGVRRSSF